MRLALALLVSIFIFACSSPAKDDRSSGSSASSASSATPTLGEANIPPEQISQVFIRVKQEVQLFLLDSFEVDEKWPDLLTDLSKTGHQIEQVCSHKPIDFQITSVQMEFDAIKEVDRGGNVSLKIPVFTLVPVANLGPSIAVTYSNTSTETLSYAYYPKNNEFYRKDFKAGHEAVIPPSVRASGVIVSSLDAMRNALVLARAQYPCFRNMQKSDPDQKIVFKVVLVKEESGAFTFSFAILSSGANVGLNRTGENTITINYRAINEQPAVISLPKKRRSKALPQTSTGGSEHRKSL